VRVVANRAGLAPPKGRRGHRRGGACADDL